MVYSGMNRYSKGQIYKIVDVGYNKCYIGSTTETLSKRMERHRSKYNSYKKGTTNNYIASFDIFNEFGVENCKIIWIKDYPCGSRKELEAEEGEHQKNTDCVNKNIAGRTKQEYGIAYYQREKERINEKHRERYQQNKEATNERHKKLFEK